MSEIVTSFAMLLQNFSTGFTQPSWISFRLLMIGWVMYPGRRTVTNLIRGSAGLSVKSFSAFHRFFSRNQWRLDQLSHALVLLLKPFLSAIVQVSVDDTLTRKGGRHIWGAAMHHDPLRSTRKKAFFSFGLNWVVLSIQLRFTFAPNKTWALPVLFRLYRPQAKKRGPGRPKGERKRTGAATEKEYRTRPELALELIQLLAQWLPAHELHVVGDSAYGGKTISRQLPANVHLYSRMCMDAALYDPASPKAPGQRGPQRKKGPRRPSPQALLKDRRYPWQRTTVSIYGKSVAVRYKTLAALWYNSAGPRLLQIVVVRDPSGRRADDCFFTTDPQATPAQILETIAARWPLEVAFHDAKQFLGLEDPQNRVAAAVERTTPMALLLYSLIIVWFAHVGHTTWKLTPWPWYPQKATPSFADMLEHLRIETIQEHIFSDPVLPPGSKNLLKPLLLWARAG